MDNILNELSAMTSLEFIAAILALLYVWFAARQNIWCWLCAFISSSIYTWIFWQVALPFQSALNLYYVIMAVFGWWSWRGIESQKQQSVIRHFPITWHLAAIAGLILLSIGLSHYVNDTHDIGYFGYLDAGVALFSVFTTFLVTQKVLENWIYWIFINSAACYLYASQGLLFTTGLFIIYVVMSLYGLYAWRCSQSSADDISSTHFAP